MSVLPPLVLGGGFEAWRGRRRPVDSGARITRFLSDLDEPDPFVSLTTLHNR